MLPARAVIVALAQDWTRSGISFYTMDGSSLYAASAITHAMSETRKPANTAEDLYAFAVGVKRTTGSGGAVEVALKKALRSVSGQGMQGSPASLCYGR